MAGAAAMALAAVATTLGFLLAAQFVAGAAWGALLMSASAGAVVLGATGAEGRALGLMFAALALATFSRIAAVAADLPHHAVVAMALPWLPAALWLAAGILLGTAFWPRRGAALAVTD